MKKFFLHGGYVTYPGIGNKNFYKSIVISSGRSDIRVLILPFARDESVWKKKMSEVQERFEEVRENKNISVSIAEREINKMTEQIQSSDVIFLWGGETQKLQGVIGSIPHFSELIEGKIIAGSSAGALVFMDSYYENDTDDYYQGLGIISGGMICHWKEQYLQRDYLRKKLGAVEVFCIPEGEYILIEK